jgi:hypothetical protein
LKIFDDVLIWEGYGGKFNLAAGRCRLRLFDLSKGDDESVPLLKPIIAVVSDLPGDRLPAMKKVSVRACISHVATTIALAGIRPVAAAETMLPATPGPSPATYMPSIRVSSCRGGFHLGGEELDFRCVEQGLVVGYARHHLVQLLQAVDDIGEDPFGQGHGDVAADHIGQGRFDIPLADPVPGAAAPPLEVPEALQNGFAAADEGGQAPDGLAVCLVVRDRFGEHHLGKEGEIGIGGFAVVVGVAVDTHEIAVALQADETALVGTESSGLVVVFAGLDEKGGVVDHVAQVLHDVVVHLHAHPHLDAPLGEADAVIPGHRGHPVGPDASRRQNHMVAAVLTAVGPDPRHPTGFDNDVLGLFGGVGGHAFGFDMVAHGGDVAGQDGRCPGASA